MTLVKYRPSNGTEADAFFANWCHRCSRDQQGDDFGCPIIADTMAYNVRDPEYPSAWRQDGPSGPRCTKFTAIGDAPNPIDPSAVIRPLL